MATPTLKPLSPTFYRLQSAAAWKNVNKLFARIQSEKDDYKRGVLIVEWHETTVSAITSILKALALEAAQAKEV